MSDIQEFISLKEAVPIITGGPKTGITISYHTIRRWCISGVFGVVLHATRVGGKLYTTREAVQDFLDKTGKIK